MNYTAIKASITNSSTRASFRHKTMALVLSLVLLIVLIPIPKADALTSILYAVHTISDKQLLFRFDSTHPDWQQSYRSHRGC